MAQPPHSEIPVASAAPPPAASGGINKQEIKQYTQYTTPPFGKRYTPEGVPIAQEKQHTQHTPPLFGQQYILTPDGVPIAQGQTSYYVRQGIPGGRALKKRPTRNEDCCATPDWIFFGLGWIFGIFWPVGVLLPLCRKPTFANPTVKGGWVANCIGTVIFIVAVIVIVAVRRKSNDSDYRY